MTKKPANASTSCPEVGSIEEIDRQQDQPAGMSVRRYCPFRDVARMADDAFRRLAYSICSALKGMSVYAWLWKVELTVELHAQGRGLSCE